LTTIGCQQPRPLVTLTTGMSGPRSWLGANMYPPCLPKTSVLYIISYNSLYNMLTQVFKFLPPVPQLL